MTLSETLKKAEVELREDYCMDSDMNAKPIRTCKDFGDGSECDACHIINKYSIAVASFLSDARKNFNRNEILCPRRKKLKECTCCEQYQRRTATVFFGVGK